MSPVNPLLILPALATALLTTSAFIKISHRKLTEVQYKTIDGLRGYLAFFVFLHHSSLWYFYLHTGTWSEPPSHLFIHFGQTSVALFFMITGFLFLRKLMQGKQKPINWLRFYMGRILRLCPVYLLVMIICFIVVLSLTQWTIAGPFSAYAKGILQWGTFGITGRPPVNHTFFMDKITAGATWTLIYEWLFYSSLPFIGIIFFKSGGNFFIVLISAAILFLIFYNNLIKPIHFYSFAIGAAAAFLVKKEKLFSRPGNTPFSIVALLCIALTIHFFETPYEIVPLTLIGISFIIIAAGNSISGLLTLKVSRTIGQISYPLYLMHPVVLFIVFRFIFGFGNAAGMNLYVYWIMISLIAAFTICICFLIHFFIELPAMKQITRVTSFIKKWNLRTPGNPGNQRRHMEI
ncbi:MAG TPA: acyltransferase [Chitinophagaceae bacterium]|nr:acyltransferase [Chitinophagaceae bacterium]